MKTNSFCISRMILDGVAYVRIVPTIQVGSVFLYKEKGKYQVLHRNGLACFWLAKATKRQAINWAKRELIQRIGSMDIDLDSNQLTTEIKEEFRELFNYSIFWGLNTWNEMPYEFI